MPKNNINIDFKENISQSNVTYSSTKQLVFPNSAKRHAIKINELEISKNNYAITNTMSTNNLISNKSSSIAIYCNEYIPDYFDKDKQYITYYLTVNSNTFEVIPINSERNGIKIIKTNDYDFNIENIEYITEPILSAYLTIVIKTPDKNRSPYISNLKVLVGDKNV